MDFSVVELTPEHEEFLDRTRRFMLSNVNPDLLRREYPDNSITQTMRDVAPDLMDVLGPVAGLASDVDYLHRWAPLVGIYGGTIDVFRNMIAQYVLGLGRPVSSSPQ